jgi:hypothetical protein
MQQKLYLLSLALWPLQDPWWLQEKVQATHPEVNTATASTSQRVGDEIASACTDIIE